jgi:hypothetical protein
MFDGNEIDLEVTDTVTDSGNTDVDNSNNLGVVLDNVGNVDNSENDDSVTNVGIDGSFNETSTSESWNIDGSFNTETWDVDVDMSDNSENDNSVNTGVREYNLGFTGGAAGAAGAAEVGGDLMINNQNTVLDQSFSGNIAGGNVAQEFASEAVVASGSGSIAAGGDVDISQELDRSTTITSGGDVLIDSTKSVDVAIGSNNVTNVDVDITDASQDWSIVGSGNSYSAVLDVDGSFNETTTDIDADLWDVDADVIWDSTVVTVGDVDVDI